MSPADRAKVLALVAGEIGEEPTRVREFRFSDGGRGLESWFGAVTLDLWADGAWLLARTDMGPVLDGGRARGRGWRQRTAKEIAQLVRHLRSLEST